MDWREGSDDRPETIHERDARIVDALGDAVKDYIENFPRSVDIPDIRIPVRTRRGTFIFSLEKPRG